MELGTICNVPLYNIYKKTGFQWKKCNIMYYKNHDICIEEVNMTKHFSKDTVN
jgi:hypothetical protein